MGNMAIKIIIITFLLIISYNKKFGRAIGNINTFFHESFHALTSLILGNKVKEIEFDTSTSGSCTSISKSKLRTVLCSLAGYIGCALLSLLFIFSIKVNQSHLTIAIISVFSFFMLLLYMRKTYPLVWTTIFACINLLIFLLPTPITIEKLILFVYSTIILIENTKSCLTILYLSFFKAKQSGDCSILAKVTKIPTFIWGLIFNAINTYVVYKYFLIIFLEK
jgi:hypothetical protein